MRKIALILGSAALLALSMASCKQSASTHPENQAGEAQAAAVVPASDEVGVISLADDNLFRPDSKVEKVTVLDFNATWCVPCKKLTPAYHLAADSLSNTVNFYSVDIDNNPLTKEAFGITSVPTVIVMSPEGKTQTFVGLGEFVKGAPEDISADGLTQVILQNLLGIVEAAK